MNRVIDTVHKCSQKKKSDFKLLGIVARYLPLGCGATSLDVWLQDQPATVTVCALIHLLLWNSVRTHLMGTQIAAHAFCHASEGRLVVAVGTDQVGLWKSPDNTVLTWAIVCILICWYHIHVYGISARTYLEWIYMYTTIRDKMT